MTTRRPAFWANDVGLSPERIERCGEDENFWPASAPSQGPDGVCGPCSEIYYHPDQGQERRDLEPRVHAVQSRGRSAEQPAAAAVEKHRHRHGPGTHRRNAAGRAHELPHRHSDADRARGGRRVRRQVRARVRQRPAAAADHRSRPGLHVRGPRKCLSRREQGKVRRQAAVAAGGARRAPDGHARAVPVQARAEGRRDDEAALPGTRRNGEAGRRRDREGRGELLRHDRRGAQPHRPRLRRDATRQSRDGRRGRGGRAVPNVWRAARAVRIAGGGAQPGIRLARLPRRDGGARRSIGQGAAHRDGREGPDRLAQAGSAFDRVSRLYDDRRRRDGDGHHRRHAAARPPLRQDARDRPRKSGAGRARSHAVLRRERRPGRRHRQGSSARASSSKSPTRKRTASW